MHAGTLVHAATLLAGTCLAGTCNVHAAATEVEGGFLHRLIDFFCDRRHPGAQGSVVDLQRHRMASLSAVQRDHLEQVDSRKLPGLLAEADRQRLGRRSEQAGTGRAVVLRPRSAA